MRFKSITFGEGTTFTQAEWTAYLQELMLEAGIESPKEIVNNTEEV